MMDKPNALKVVKSRELPCAPVEGSVTDRVEGVSGTGESWVDVLVAVPADTETIGEDEVTPTRDGEWSVW